MKSLYSIAIHPPEDLIASIRTMKEDLADKIGWYNSKNSVAHITINEFEAGDTEIGRIAGQLTQLCDSIEPVSICLNAFGSYPNNGAFFIAPDEASKKELKAIMKYINDRLHVKASFKSSDPHLSIGRRLTPEKLAVADSLFTAIDLHFICNSVVIRKFNTERKQFDVAGTFTFNGNTILPVQGTLF
jgi:2'-5' RNA ligase